MIILKLVKIFFLDSYIMTQNLISLYLYKHILYKPHPIHKTVTTLQRSQSMDNFIKFQWPWIL